MQPRSGTTSADSSPAKRARNDNLGVIAYKKKVCRVCEHALVLLFVLLSPFRLFAQNIITTVAGTTWVFRGDGGPALNAPLGTIAGLAADRVGNLYAADSANHLVVKISPLGTLTVFAGNGIRGFSGDGGTATSASLNLPSGVALDSNGNLYISDAGNHRVRRVSSSGIITTFAGTGSATSTVTNVGDGGPASNASLASPSGLAIDSDGSLYIADTGHNRIRKVLASGIISTVAGNGGTTGGPGQPNFPPALATSLPFNSPVGVAVDGTGVLYVAVTGRNNIWSVDLAGNTRLVAGNIVGIPGSAGDNGPATGAFLFNPTGVMVDASGNIYIADSLNHRIRKVNASGTITTVAGTGLRGFGGDQGAAGSALLDTPGAVALDFTGALLIADSENYRVRRVGSAGTITTVAGNGTFKFSGDGGPATSASLRSPNGAALDALGNLYIADTANHRVRKVSSEGTITTLAGNGIAGYSGDGGPATGASLRSPAGVAVDGAGNVYIADTLNHRIRKATLLGTLTTIAGNGLAGFTGDAGPATSASLNFPFGVAADASGNVYIADTFNNAVRKVGSTGIITTVLAVSQPFGVALDAAGNVLTSDLGGIAVSASGTRYTAESRNHRVRKTIGSTTTAVAGTGQAGFSGDGGPATAAQLNGPSGVAADAVGNIYIADTQNDRVRKVLAVPPSFFLVPESLSFTATFGAAVVAPQPIGVSGFVPGLGWTSQVSTADGGNWLSISPASGSIPAAITVNVSPGNLAPGTYRGAVTVQVPLAIPTAQTVAVELTVQLAPSAELAVQPSTITFEVNAGAGNPPEQRLRIGNAGAGTLNWTASTSTTSGGNWLSVSPASGSASAASPAAVQLSANATGLAPGVYSGSVRIESPQTSQPATVPVTLLVSQVTQTILLSQNGLLFTGVEGGGIVPPDTFGILNTGQGGMEWTVEAGTLAGGGWLSVSHSSGRSEAGSAQVPLVQVGVNVTGMRAGQYSGLIRVRAPGANNSPQVVTVTLNVLPTGSNPGVVVRPTGLIFVRQAGTSSPSSQTARLFTSVPGSTEAVANPATLRGGKWLQVAPTSLVISPTDSRTITVQPNLESLPVGEYFGGITLLFSDRRSQTVNVLFVVTSPTAGAASLARSWEDRATGGVQPLEPSCVPKQLYAALRTLGGNFDSLVGWPSTIEVQVVEDCGSPVPDATVLASFTNGDPPLVLTSLRNGLYVGTWRPATSAGQVGITVQAELPPLAPARIQTQGQVRTNPQAPLVNSGGIVNAASFAPREALAPGSIVSVFGRNLASAKNEATTRPLPTTLGGITLLVGGVEAPLIASDREQINAQLPFGLAPNSRIQVVVRALRDGGGSEALTVPETITIAAARPGIFTTNNEGTGQGVIQNQDYSPNSASNPAARGSAVIIYATGLGATNPSVPSGQPAPSAEPLASVVILVTAQVGGRTATVDFAGLAPGWVGLYQVNVKIPADLQPGPAVPLVLLQNGVPSNTVTLAVR